ncbi:MAG TPA: CPBP family intramembrane glutamic endopeptidase [Verrucomicrobiae bacterium]|jgi:membrane protease YdiL (CAAX protease family)|nr:CPBP family intramembrane glutamic endopeptidase [Verrucomicrobiae bacterium]
MQNVTPAAVVAFVMELAPAVAFGFAAERIPRFIQRWPVALRLCFPSVCVVPYVLISVSAHIVRWHWFALYFALPVVIAWLLERAAAADPEQHGNWRDAIILLVLGLSVDLRWLDSAWPSGLQALNKLLLVDMGLYGFLAIRQLRGVGFDFHLRWRDWKTGLRELVFFTPLVLILGVALGFIHPHTNRPQVNTAVLRWLLIFLFTALPEELFFRGWVQNQLERRVGRRMALAIASALFGLSHFNKRAAHFNWRYVLLAAIAGIFYGRAWREHRRVAASTITHASVDWIWGLWF